MSKLVFSLEDSLKKFEQDLQTLAPRLEDECSRIIDDVVNNAYAAIVAKAQAELHTTRADYLKGLRLDRLADNTYLITLDGVWANKIEDGYPAYDLVKVLLRSQKTVEVGSRSGEPWVQKTVEKKGKPSHKYAHVPFERQPFSKDPRAAEMAEAIKKITATNAKGREQKITSIFKDAEGNPLEGKVAVGRSDNPLLDNLVKYQRRYNNRTQSIFINYRTISEAGKPWNHPGWRGLRAFDEAEKQLVEQLSQAIDKIFGGQ